jgi:hexosaminidase
MKRLWGFTALCSMVLANLTLSPAMAQVPSNSKHLKVSIIPEPVKVVPGINSYRINKNTVIVASGEEQLKSAKFLKDYILKYYNVELAIIPARDANGKEIKIKKNKEAEIKHVVLDIKPLAYGIAGFSPSDLKKTGAYTLNTKDGILNLTGANPEGLFYAVQTLIQLLPSTVPQLGLFDKYLQIPVQEIEIVDYPRFQYRGMHLDVVRHIFPVEYIKQYIDYLALHKLNYFHWHLTDDQGWRMESKAYPKLNEIGSWRAGTIIGLFPGTGVDSTRYGGYYTIEQMKDIVKYAADRYITIVPEIDIPGHSMAIISAYPELSTTPDIPKQPAITWGIFNRQNNVLLPSEQTFKFLKDVFNELMDIFPGEYIHVGGDECSPIWWRDSRETQAFMKNYGIKDETELQGYFLKRVYDVVKARGRKLVGWDEILESPSYLAKDMVVMSWRDARHGWKAAEMGHKTIIASVNQHYFNTAQRKDETALCHKNFFVPLDSVYYFEPIPDIYNSAYEENILGGEGCMWTEYFPDKAAVEYAIFPRMSAFSEVYWSQSKNKNWPKFMLKLVEQFNRYDLWGAGYCTYIFESGHYSR